MLQDTIRIMLNREFNILKKSLLLFFRTILIWVMLPETSGEIQYFLLVLMFHIFEVPVWKLYQSAWCEKQKYFFIHLEIWWWFQFANILWQTFNIGDWCWWYLLCSNSIIKSPLSTSHRMNPIPSKLKLHIVLWSRLWLGSKHKMTSFMFKRAFHCIEDYVI